MGDREFPLFFVTLKTNDRPLLEMQKKVDKLSLIQVWVMKASSLFERYLRTLDLIDRESDSVKKGILVEEIDICFMSSVSYFLRSFMSQEGSLKLEIKNVTDDPVLRDTYQMLMDLRNDEYVHWKGARSSALVKYSFTARSETECEFGSSVQVGFNESVGPQQKTEEIRKLYQAALAYIESRRNQELQAMRLRLAKAEAWQTTQLLNDAGESIIKQT